MQKRILVVDDDVAILDVVKLILEGQGYSIETSENGAIFPTVVNHKPDLILLDMLLSGEDGRDVARKLKANKETQSIPIVMISAHPSAAAGSLQAGADKFLSKPFEIEELLSVVSGTLGSN